ncbi:MAG: hypothetical protein ACI4I9_06750 [Porcipelethomonas sp.]
MNKIVKIKYNSEVPSAEITFEENRMDVSRIAGRKIEEWAYPFIVKNIRWNGICDELKEFTGSNEITIQFSGTDKEMGILKDAVKNTAIKVAGTNNKVVILYKKEPFSTKITVNGKIFDTSKIQNRTIDEWIYPFQFREIKWDGIFKELENYLNTDLYSIQFVGEQEDMKELMKECPENVSISFKAPVTSSKSFSDVSAAGSAIIGNAKEKLGNITQNNESVKKAKGAAVNAGKKLDEGISNAVINIKNSEQYNKVMENEKVQKVMNNKNVRKISAFWSKLDKKLRYVICIAAVFIIILIPIICLTGGGTIKISGDDNAMSCPHECKAGFVGFDYFEDDIGTLYFRAADHAKVYLVECEDGTSKETIAEESEIYERNNAYNNYDTYLQGTDSDGNGIIEYTISVFDGSEYDKVCTIKCKLG